VLSKVNFIGDLSTQDVEIIKDYSSKAKRILEFGVGGSTQIMAQIAPTSTEIISVDSSPAWINKTKELMKLLKIDRQVEFHLYKSWNKEIKGKFDLIFNDGQPALRASFLKDSWDMLDVGGYMLFHDTRMPEYFKNVYVLFENPFLNDIEDMYFNQKDSNITVIKKKIRTRYKNWNILEKKEKWEISQAEIPSILPQWFWEKKY